MNNYTFILVFESRGASVIKLFFTFFIVLPGPVQQLLAVALTPQSMRVSWQLPVEENNEIINYSVNITVVGSNETLQIVTITSYVTVESLHPNYLYQCSVAARNNDGLGPPANVIKRTPPDGERVRVVVYCCKSVCSSFSTCNSSQLSSPPINGHQCGS